LPSRENLAGWLALVGGAVIIGETEGNVADRTAEESPVTVAI
jgi:ADP-ribose pyrophosphatase YjhB (NUDIX family)